MDPLQQALERALVIRCQVGDRQALAELFVLHHRRLGYYLRRMLGRDEVDDVQQEVWLAVIRRIARLRSPEAFVVWLYQIARRKALDRLGQRKPPASLESEPTADLEAPEPELSEADAERIHGALNQLSPEHREALVLRFMEDLSYEQIAEVTGSSAGTVKSRLHYAKLALAKQLEQKQ